jgi:hypothetical protein
VSRTVGGGWHRTVELQDGERVLYEADAGWRNAPWLGSTRGKLYLTNQRLVWARARLQLPLPRQPILAIPMGDILGTQVKTPLFGSRYSLLVRTRERTYRFVLLPVSLEEDIEACRDMIEKARGSREAGS